MNEWHPTDEMMAEILPIAQGRDKLSDKAENTRRWTSDFNLIGLVGEKLYSQLTGLPYNMEIKLGDGGEDFPGVDIKTTRGGESGAKLRAPLKFKFIADYYVLVVWDRSRSRARVAGWCSRAEFRAAPQVKLKFGVCYQLPEHHLRSGLPPRG